MTITFSDTGDIEYKEIESEDMPSPLPSISSEDLPPLQLPSLPSFSFLTPSGKVNT